MYGFRPTMTRAQISKYIVGFILVCVQMLFVCTQGVSSCIASREIIQQSRELIINETLHCTAEPYRSLEARSPITREVFEQTLLGERFTQETSVDMPQRPQIILSLDQSLCALAESLVNERSVVFIKGVIHPDRRANDLQIVVNLEQDPDFITHFINEFTLTDPHFSSRV